MIIQGGAYGEHQIIQAGTTKVNRRAVEIALAPGAGTAIHLALKRYANRPQYAFPWENAAMRFAFLLALPAFAQMGSPGGGETFATAFIPPTPTFSSSAPPRDSVRQRRRQGQLPTVRMDSLGPRAIALDPANPDVIYIGTYEVGVYKIQTAPGVEDFSRSNGITDPHIARSPRPPGRSTPARTAAESSRPPTARLRGTK